MQLPETRMQKKRKDETSPNRKPIGECFLCGDGTPATRRRRIESDDLLREVQRVAGRKLRKKDAGTGRRRIKGERVVALCNKHYERLRVTNRAVLRRKQRLTPEQIAEAQRCLRTGERTMQELADEWGVNRQTVWLRAQLGGYRREEVD